MSGIGRSKYSLVAHSAAPKRCPHPAKGDIRALER
jgi:hypothetical protein